MKSSVEDNGAEAEDGDAAALHRVASGKPPQKDGGAGRIGVAKSRWPAELTGLRRRRGCVGVRLMGIG
jgi:hypothetical protein